MGNEDLLERYSVINWIVKYGIKTEDGYEYSFETHPFMFDVLRELAKCEKDVVTYKAAQIGFSTASMLATFWIAKNKNYSIIYTLPTQTDVKDFAGGKINRIVAQNPVLQEWVKDRDTVEQKSVGDSIIYYRGTFSSKQAMMVSSDLNAYDEVDASDQKVIEQYETRLQASNVGVQWYFSHPSVPGNGVSKHWEDSDQRHWVVTCPSCEASQYIVYPESFDLEKEIYVCRACQGELTDDCRRRGKWMSKNKGAKKIGFWIPLWIVPRVSASEIIKYKREKSEEYFQNKVAGLPYVGSGNKPTYDMITKNLTDAVNDQSGNIVIGCDTGLTQYYVVGNLEGVFYYGKSKGYDEIEKMLVKWPKAIVVFDAAGDLVKPRELREKYNGRVFLCHYSVDRKTMQLIRWGKSDESGNVTADRNRMIQLCVDELSDGRVNLHGTAEDYQDFWLHWNNIYRTQEENKLGVIEKKWERSGDDHWVHAYVYWRIGMNRYGVGEGAVIGDDKITFARTSPTISPDGTMPAIKPKVILSDQKAFK